MHIGIIGLGLIGGSLLKKLHSQSDILGYDIDEQVRTKVKQAGFRVRNDLNELMHNCEILVLAMGTNAAPQVLKEISKANYSGLVSDVGSTKAAMHELVDEKLNFVGGHPMAGSHLAGWEAATPEIFNQAPWALTLDRVTDEIKLAELIKFILKTGARVVPTFAKEHDAAVLISSHLSHLVSASYGITASKAANAKLIEALVGGSYRDLTRITLSPSDRTAEIIWPNRTDLVTAIDELVSNVQNLKKSLKAENPENLIKQLNLASTSRSSVEELEAKIKKQEIQEISVPAGRLIEELKELTTDAVSITSFKNQNDDYEIKFIK